MRHLGGAVHFQEVVCFVVARDGATRFQRHAAVAADGDIERDDLSGGAEGRLHVAGFLFDDGRLGAAFSVERARRPGGIEEHRQGRDVERDQIGGVFGNILVVGEDGGHRLADIAHQCRWRARIAGKVPAP